MAGWPKPPLGDKHWNWNGGVEKTGNGYLRIGKTGQAHHRAIMENKLGRKLTKNEVIHHRDGDKQNNKISNLKLMTPSEHSKLHWRLKIWK